MPTYFTNLSLWVSNLLLLAMATALALLFTLLLSAEEHKREVFKVLSAFSVLGMVAGYLAGASREPAIDSVLPAVLSLMGGLAIFLVGKNPESRGIVSISIIMFCITLLFGTGAGSVIREQYVREQRIVDHIFDGISRAHDEEIEKYKNSELYLKHRALIDSEVDVFKRNLKINPD